MITMKSKTARLRALGLSIATAIVLGGCLLSAQFMITLLFGGPFHYAFNGTGAGSFDAVNVDLSEEEDWEDNKEDIKRIESIRFGGEVTNNTAQDDVVSMYISKTQYNNAADLMNATDAYAVLVGLPVPGSANRMVMTAAQTDIYRNMKPADLEKIRNIIIFGQFFTYAIGANANFDLLFHNCVYHIAFSAAK